MFSKTEQSATEAAVVAKLVAFKRMLDARQPSENVYYRFLLDVLKDVLEKIEPIVPSIFPLNEMDIESFGQLLYQQYYLIHVEDEELNSKTIHRTFETNPRAVGLDSIILHKDKLYYARMDEASGAYHLKLLEPAPHVIGASQRLKKYIGEHAHIIPGRYHCIPNDSQCVDIALLLDQLPEVSQKQPDQLLLVLTLIQDIVDGLEMKKNNAQSFKTYFLQAAVVVSVMGSLGALAFLGSHFLVAYMLGLLTLAQILITVYISVAVLGAILAVTLGMALYYAIYESHYTAQLSQLLETVNQSKTYALTEELPKAMFTGLNDEARGMIKHQSRTTAEYEGARKDRIRITVNADDVGLFFSQHREAYREVAEAFEFALT